MGRIVRNPYREALSAELSCAVGAEPAPPKRLEGLHPCARGLREPIQVRARGMNVMVARMVRFLALLLAAAMLANPAHAAPARPDPAQLSAGEVTALQRQLTDAKCYSGPLDGKPSEALDSALAACPDPRAMLRIETGMHVAGINRIGVDSQCRLLATGSDDKTVRLWSMPAGRLIRTQRLPIGSGHNGKVFAVAVSPDGRYVAAGGWDAARESGRGHSIYLFDAATGTQMRRLGAFESLIPHLTFSSDGVLIAVALGGGQGIRVLDVATGRELLADRDFGGRTGNGVTFGPDGAIYAVGDDGSLRRYSPELKLTGKVTTIGGKRPFSVSVDSSGQRLAVGFSDNTAVDLYDAQSLRRIAPADTQGVDNGDLSTVVWSRDGKQLIAGGSYNHSSGQNEVVRFSPKGRRLGAGILVSDNTILSLVTCDEATAFATADPSLGLIRSDGRAVTLARGRTVDMRAKFGDAFTVSSDGTRLRIGLGYGSAAPVLFDLGKATLNDWFKSDYNLAAPDIVGLPVTGWKNTLEPRFKDNLIKLDGNQLSRSLAIRPDKTGFVLGTEYSLRAYDAGGKESWPPRATSGPTYGVNLARGGELIVAAYGDGTIRWHRWSDSQELLALFVDRESRAWVAWTPSGYYSASPGGEDLIGWQVNRGWEQPADFFPASKFRDQYARPDIVERVLDTLDEAEAVKQANAARGGKQTEAIPIAERLPPVVSILSPVEGSIVSGDEARIDYVVRSPSGLPVEAVDALIDGRPVSTGRGLGRDDEAQVAMRACLTSTRGLGRDEGGQQGCRGTINLRLPPGTSEIGLFARTGGRAGDVARIRLVRAAAASNTELEKPRLFALVVGISAYANPDYRLGYAAKDAADFAGALQNQQGGLYGAVMVRALADGNATATAIKDGLDWLTKQVTARDVGLLYLAGHGLLDERERFYFLPADGDAERVRATGVPREDIQEALDALPGKALLFLDACHSGAIATKRRRDLNINVVANEFASSERGVVAFTASTGRQLSQENPAWGNGAFTKAVIEAMGTVGIKAKADFLGKGRITASALDTYVSDRVRELTGGQQSPIMIRPPTVPDFAFALVR